MAKSRRMMSIRLNEYGKTEFVDEATGDVVKSSNEEQTLGHHHHDNHNNQEKIPHQNKNRNNPRPGSKRQGGRNH
jgi:hypothetical protein